MDKISELENKVKETEAKVRSSVNKYDNMHNQYQSEKARVQKELEQSKEDAESREEKLIKWINELKNESKSFEEKLDEAQNELEGKITEEECDAIHTPKLALYEKANANLTLKLEKSEDELEECSRAKPVYLAEIEDINQEKEELEKISEAQLKRLK